MMFFDQSAFDVRFEWGARGVAALGPDVRTIVIVDVLSFSTCVEVATSREAFVLPYGVYGAHEEELEAYAQSRSAIVAKRHREAPDSFTLSPVSLMKLSPGMRLVLPSPNGSTLSQAASKFGTVTTACLRNATAVAKFVSQHPGPVAVIACGERWPDGSLRPAWEDQIGAGAVISHLPGRKSPEALTAADAFEQASNRLAVRLRDCASGRELIEGGFTADVDLASMLDISQCVPVLKNHAFTAHDLAASAP
ncbi:2-phosphosulfolactate phosphatase [Schlesneria paludicola]|uniref:2-phosphosulfolactate phosphatase n=1 Tax=Schlesneria paludicola TaxID=360056 RepID=UPI00029A44D8|nr:2-phosphosulfolactate phosphatase [Schlesneria paludicola]